MEQHGGKRDKAGRKPKAEEQKLVEKLSPLEDNAHKALKDAVNAGEKWAIELFFKYMYGLPKQTVDLNNNIKGEIPIDKWFQ
jgi:hypothetical protein